MQVTIQPGKVSGIIQANASKSAMQRACAAALLKEGITIIHNPGISNDDKAALDIIQKLGATITYNGNGTIAIKSAGVDPINTTINCGESGLSIRMFTPIASLSDKKISITGEGSLVTRPMDFFDEVMPMVGVNCSSENGKLPLQIQGPLQPSDITIDGSLSSQFLTGLLMAYGAAPSSKVEHAENKPITITVTNLKSKPYIDLTLEIMKAFGLNVPENRNYKEFVFSNSTHIMLPDSSDATHHSPLTTHHSRLTTHDYTVEGDWSGAAFLLVAGAVAGSVTVNGIFNTSRQADKKIVDAILDAGADVEVTATSVKVSKQQLRAFVFDATDCPDLFPPLVALAANCDGVTRIHGLKRLKHKESDRGLTLQEEFSKLGIRIDLEEDIMLVYGKSHIKLLNQTLNSHHDHRIAMAGVIAALNADFEIHIRHAEAINKSYPDFYRHMQQLGVQVETK
ncbi:MAG: 3-phosphoshikimate 1-carboxyvinyltransferase [Bacteroidota bacterium]